MAVFRIAPIEKEGKKKVVHQNLLLPISTKAKDSENSESQQGVNGPPDCIWAASDGDAETEIVPAGPESEGESDAIHVQSVLYEYEPDD